MNWSLTAIAFKIALKLFPFLDYKIELSGNRIRVPGECSLRYNQVRFRLYDRFLPVLARHIPDNTSIIDVGANSGDTLASMYLAESNHVFLCIDADAKFFQYLKSNAELLPGNKDRVTVVNCLVGADVDNVVLIGKGTRTAKNISTNGHESKLLRSRRLDGIVTENKISNVSVIKSDVDGFDYDVLLSAEKLIKDDRPVLYFECDVHESHQVEGYKKLLSILETSGYNQFAIFDNYGAMIAVVSDSAVVFDMICYSFNLNRLKSMRTLHYVDVLAFNKTNVFVTEALNEYKRFQAAGLSE
jgi:FkbM family methyltransferase